MVNSSWTDPHQHVKQNGSKNKKRSFRSTDQDSTDMIFITPDHIAVSKPNGAL